MYREVKSRLIKLRRFLKPEYGRYGYLKQIMKRAIEKINKLAFFQQICASCCRLFSIA